MKNGEFTSPFFARQIAVLRIAFSSGEGGPPKVVDEEVAIKVFDTGILWILSCSIKILLQRNNVFKRREVLDRMPSSSTQNAQRRRIAHYSPCGVCPPSPLGKA
ncbi:MAG: hypothetical protein E7611_07010 [Ruminococcaceae bacterium]|nr:hypothetical protein [Oscillospiraceae bacterium]